MPVTRGDAVALAKALVAVDSQNPSLVPGGAGESAVAAMLGDVLRDWGFAVELHEVAPGRPNVVARIGRSGGRSLMYNGHLDVVGVSGMTHAPFAADERDGRIHGRGAADMKAGIAAMCAAAAGGIVTTSGAPPQRLATSGDRATTRSLRGGRRPASARTTGADAGTSLGCCSIVMRIEPSSRGSASFTRSHSSSISSRTCSVVSPGMVRRSTDSSHRSG
jgi:hypothetical protein